jgi:hypothetical protein
METADEVRAHLDALREAAWELAALVLALEDRTEVSPDARRAAVDLLVTRGLFVASDDGPRPSAALDEVLGGRAPMVAAQTAAAITQPAGLVAGADVWTRQDDEAILAQGRASAQAPMMFKAFVLPSLEGLAELLDAPGAAMLDVGVGVAAMAVAYCETFPNLRVVGLDVFPRALELAARVIDEAGVADRVELRLQDVAALDERGVYALGWLPAPFIPRPALEAAVPRMAAALVPGGWLMLAHGRLDEPGIAPALTRLQTAVFGGTTLEAAEAQALLSDAGLVQVFSPPSPPGAPALAFGRAPQASS